MELKLNLTAEQARFTLWLESEMPYLLPLFNFNDAAYIPELVERYLAGAPASF